MRLRPNPILVYADTTVFDGIVDPEFETVSRTFFRLIAIHSPPEVINENEQEII